MCQFLLLMRSAVLFPSVVLVVTIEQFDFDSIDYSIHQFMSEEHLHALSSWTHLADPPKRRRTPSQYASHIADFKNNVALTTRRPKNLRFAEEPSEEPSRPVPAQPLTCKLPSGKTYRLTIITTKNPSTHRQEKRRLKRAESAVSNPPVEQKKAEESVRLLNKFASVIQNLQKEQEVDSKSNNQPSKQNRQPRPPRREQRIRRERDRQQKWSKGYQRYMSLGQRLDRLQETYIFLM